MAQDNTWEIAIAAPFGGFAPGWYKNTYHFLGNANQAGDMNAIDLRDPNCFKQGAGLAALTNGTQAGAVTTLVTAITRIVSASDTAFAGGGNLVHKISSTAVTNAGSFPHTVDKAAVTDETISDVVLYQGNLYYSYNHSGSAGDVGQYDLSSTFDDDYMSTTPTGAAALQNAPHQMIVAADVLYIANGRYIAFFDGTTFDPGTGDSGLDFKVGSQVESIAYAGNRIYAAVNYPAVSGSNANRGEIYIWDGSSPSWEYSIPIQGRLGALYEDGGTVFVWWQEDNDDGGYKFGYVSGTAVVEIECFSGSMPTFYQITKSSGYLHWISNGRVYTWGSSIKNKVPPILFDFSDGGLTTVGALGSPFDTIIVASNSGASYQLAKHSGLETESYWTTLTFDVSRGRIKSLIEEIVVEFYPMSVNAQVDVTLLYDYGSNESLGSISHSGDGASVSQKTFYNPKVQVRNFQLKFDYTNGNTTNSVEIRKIYIKGRYVPV